MNENDFSYKLMELGFFLHCVTRGEKELNNEMIKELFDAICKAQKIVQTLEIRKRSLNNLRDEVDRYMDEFNELID
jgi:hypothetical protein